MRVSYRLTFLKNLAWITLLSEQIILRFMPLFIWCCGFFGLWAFDLNAILEPLFSALFSLSFLLGVTFLSLSGFKNLELPTQEDINRRLEISNKLPNRPLSELEDPPINYATPESQTLWEHHKQRLQTILKTIQPARFQPHSAQRDRYALRYLAFMFLTAGLLTSGASGITKIKHGISAPLQDIHIRGWSTPPINIWIEPPSYTGLPHIVLNNQNQVLEIPQNSVIKATTVARLFKPSLKMGEYKYKFKPAEGNAYKIHATIDENSNAFSLQILPFTKQSWHYNIIPDTPPEITLRNPPVPHIDGALAFPLTLSDDYGVQKLKLHIKYPDNIPMPVLGHVFSEERIISLPAGETIALQPAFNYSHHPWAGRAVIFSLSAFDAKGQEAKLPPITMPLPEKIFHHPLAKALIGCRKGLIENPIKNYRPLAQQIREVMIQPHQYGHDTRVFLALRTATSRLYYSQPSKETAQAIIKLLWHTANRIEGSDLSLASQELRDIQKRLQNALNNPKTTDAELATLMHEFQDILQKYIQELSKDIQKQDGSNALHTENLIFPDTFSDFMSQLQEELRSGNKKKAQDMLAQLGHMMDMLSPSMSFETPHDVQEMQSGLRELEDIITAQEDLLKRTYIIATKDMVTNDSSFGKNLPADDKLMKQWELEGMPPPPTTSKTPLHGTKAESFASYAVEQNIIRAQLSDLMAGISGAIGEIPDNFGHAELEMQESSTSLNKTNPQKAARHQELALNALKQGQQQINEQLAQRIKQMMILPFNDHNGMRYDPLGRPYGGRGGGQGPHNGSRVIIPDQGAAHRAQRVLELLRERSSQHDRPQHELEYYRRLLKRF